MHRLKADAIARRRFELVDCLGRPSDCWTEGRGPLECLQSVHKAERKLYGVPFRHEGDFVLQVSRFAALRATLLPLVGSDDALRESLRLFEEAESGLRSEYPAHMFHQIIIHTQRAYTLMLIARTSMRRYRAIRPGKPPMLLGMDNYKGDIINTSLRIATQRLAEARAELGIAEEILSGGRRNVRIWLRLYHARAQLAIEELVRLCAVVEFDPSSLGKEHAFVAEIQEWLLFGLESIRGALDCTVYDESARRGPRLANEHYGSERDDFASAIKLYLQLFVTGRLTLQGYSAARDAGTRPSTSTWQAMMESKRLAGEQEFLERWEALNESVGLVRVFRILRERERPNAPVQSDAEQRSATIPHDNRWLVWKDIVTLCDAPVYAVGRDGSTDHPEPLRECALHKMEMLSKDHHPPIPRLTGHTVPKSSTASPWLIDVILHQRSEIRREEDSAARGAHSRTIDPLT